MNFEIKKKKTTQLKALTHASNKKIEKKKIQNTRSLEPLSQQAQHPVRTPFLHLVLVTCGPPSPSLDQMTGGPHRVFFSLIALPPVRTFRVDLVIGYPEGIHGEKSSCYSKLNCKGIPPP